MFTLAQIKEAHSKVKSGADFPRYVQELLLLSVQRYSIYVYDGHAEYRGEGDYKISSGPEYPFLQIASEVKSDKFKNILKDHQQGKTDYFTFCENAAETGISKWVVDIRSKRCTYFDESGSQILEETVPI